MQRLIHLHVLASGSKGNAAVVCGPAGSVLIDCGISRRSLMQRAAELDVDLASLTAVIVTHEHSDHVSGLPVFSKRFEGPLYATPGTIAARAGLADLGFATIRHRDALDLAGMHIETFPTSHDVADPIGLRFSVSDESGTVVDALGWCTDTGFLTPDALTMLRGCRILGIESNHDVTMLRTGPYPRFLQQRVGGRSGHLSNDQCAEALPELVTEETEEVVALHLSEKNNLPSTCIRTLAAALDAEPINETFTRARTADGHVTLRAAAQTRPLTIW